MAEILSRNNTESISYPLILNNNRGKDVNNITKPIKIKKRQNLILKKSNSLNYITNTNENNSKTIEIINSINLAKNKNINKMNLKNNSYALDLFSKHRAIDNESLQMNNRQLKTEINKIKRILTNIKKKNSEKDNEISKQEVLIDQLLNINKQAYLNTLSSLDTIPQNDGIENNIICNNLICKISKQYQELQNSNKEKEKEIKELRKNYKNSKMNELNIENNILQNHYNKYKNL